MMKKIIMTSVLGISALALVNANAEVAPATAPGGKALHAKKHSHPKKTMKSARQADQTPSAMPAENISTTVPAQPVSTNMGHQGLPAGLYVGAQSGYAESVSPLIHTPDFSQVNNNGLAGRLSIGYQINKNFAVEAGYLALHTTRSALNVNGKGRQVNRQNVIDIAGKGSYPIADRMSLYGKAGIAYISTAYDVKINQATIQVNNVYGVARHKFAPEVAVGMNFDVTPNVAVDTSLTHIHPLGNNRPGNINYLAVGVHYTFG